MILFPIKSIFFVPSLCRLFLSSPIVILDQNSLYIESLLPSEKLLCWGLVSVNTLKSAIIGILVFCVLAPMAFAAPASWPSDSDWLRFGTDPTNDGTNDDWRDIINVSSFCDGTYLFLRETMVGEPALPGDSCGSDDSAANGTQACTEQVRYKYFLNGIPTDGESLGDHLIFIEDRVDPVDGAYELYYVEDLNNDDDFDDDMDKNVGGSQQYDKNSDNFVTENPGLVNDSYGYRVLGTPTNSVDFYLRLSDLGYASCDEFELLAATDPDESTPIDQQPHTDVAPESFETPLEPVCEQNQTFLGCSGTPNACDGYNEESSCESAGCSWNATVWSNSFNNLAETNDWALWNSTGGILNESGSGCASGRCINADGGTVSYNLSKQSNLDLSSCLEGTAIFSIGNVEESGMLDPDDCLYVWFSNDGGSTWVNRTLIYCDDNTSISTFSISVPDTHLQNDFRIRIEKQGFLEGGEEGYLDDFSITCNKADSCSGTPNTCDAYDSDGNACVENGCTSLCEVPLVCGNNILQTSEQCDDGNIANGDGCSSTCVFEPSTVTVKKLVDGIAAANWTFNVSVPNAVPSNFGLITNINGLASAQIFLNASNTTFFSISEVLKPGFDLTGFACTINNITSGSPETSTQWDTNLARGQTILCSFNNTELTFCGDGIQQSPNDNGFNEQCDGTDGVGLYQVCSANCELISLTYCGDGIVQNPNNESSGGPHNDGFEQCDDGNTNNNDGCENDCTCKDKDDDGVCDFVDQCPDTLPNDLVDEFGCSQEQFCREVALCGTTCDYADWLNDEINATNPFDCITSIIHEGGKPRPICAPVLCFEPEDK